MKYLILTQEESDSLYSCLVDNFELSTNQFYKEIDKWWAKYLGYTPYKVERIKNWEFEIYSNPE